MTRKKLMTLLYLFAMAGLLAWFAYAKGWILANFPSVTPERAITLLAQNDNNISLLDVRSPKEFQSGHLTGATLIPLGKLEESLDKLAPLKGKTILVYCRSGMRSIAASRILQKHGFHPVNIKGGIIGLSAAKAEIVR
ncbi:MAG TPA: rhodanese-like domain-containing protein [Epsilonproteobacteria bacterium]|nr:rhodanese-like domain-containing protein [Campylobacterota bacterium]